MPDPPHDPFSLPDEPLTDDAADDDAAPEVTVLDFTIAPGQRPTRLDVYLTQHIENATRAKVQQGIAAGRVTVNSRPAKASRPTQPGDRIAVTLLRPPPTEAQPEDLPLDIVYEDDDLLLVNKAAGMVVHPAYGNPTGTLVNALLHHVRQLSTVNGADIRPGIVHRLDKDTSGLLVVAKTDIAHARLAAQFARRTTEREYWALVWGVPAPPDGTVETDVGRDPRDRKRMAVVETGTGKTAITGYRTLEPHRRTALLALKLGTGRTHQIRVHMAHLGHPLVGDPTYGGRDARWLTMDPSGAQRSAWARLIDGLPGQALHARTLGFRHPTTGEPVRFEAPPPEAFLTALGSARQA